MRPCTYATCARACTWYVNAALSRACVCHAFIHARTHTQEDHLGQISQGDTRDHQRQATRCGKSLPDCGTPVSANRLLLAHGARSCAVPARQPASIPSEGQHARITRAVHPRGWTWVGWGRVRSCLTIPLLVRACVCRRCHDPSPGSCRETRLSR
jgi:hypothetical protein